MGMTVSTQLSIPAVKLRAAVLSDVEGGAYSSLSTEAFAYQPAIGRDVYLEASSPNRASSVGFSSHSTMSAPRTLTHFWTIPQVLLN